MSHFPWLSCCNVISHSSKKRHVTQLLNSVDDPKGAGDIKSSLVLGKDECLGLWGTELGIAPKEGELHWFGSRFLFLAPPIVDPGGFFLCLASCSER